VRQSSQARLCVVDEVLRAQARRRRMRRAGLAVVLLLAVVAIPRLDRPSGPSPRPMISSVQPGIRLLPVILPVTSPAVVSPEAARHVGWPSDP